MTLAPEAQIGPYRVVSMIGRGGMGEVYRARDTRLRRDVAIKTIAVDSAHDSVFRARLEREARAVAALNHPHICAIYDVGREDSVDYVVFEYIGGETLAVKFARAPRRWIARLITRFRSQTRLPRRTAPASFIAISSRATS